MKSKDAKVIQTGWPAAAIGEIIYFVGGDEPKMQTFRVIALAIAAALSLQYARCAELSTVAVIRGGAPETRGTAVMLNGMIAVSDVAAIISALAESSKIGPYFELDLASRGGDMDAGISIGRDLRLAGAWTFAVGECYSACVMILAGGLERNITFGTAKIGIHRPYVEPSYFAKLPFNRAGAEYATLAANVRTYLIEMGISASLFEMMMRVPSSTVRILTEQEMHDTALVGVDPAYDEWLTARAANLKGSRQSDLPPLKGTATYLDPPK